MRLTRVVNIDDKLRRLYAAGGVTQRQLGTKFNRSQVSIGEIVRMETRADA